MAKAELVASAFCCIMDVCTDYTQSWMTAVEGLGSNLPIHTSHAVPCILRTQG